MAFSLIFAPDVIVRETTLTRGIDFGRLDGALYERHYEPTTVYFVIEKTSQRIRVLIPTHLGTLEKRPDTFLQGVRINMDIFNLSRRGRLWPLRLFLEIAIHQHMVRWSILRGFGHKFSDRFIFRTGDGGILNIPTYPFIQVVDTSNNKIVWKK